MPRPGRFGPGVATEVRQDGTVRQFEVTSGPFHVGTVAKTSPLTVDCPCDEPLRPSFRSVPVEVGMRVLVAEVGAELIVLQEVVDA